MTCWPIWSVLARLGIALLVEVVHHSIYSRYPACGADVGAIAIGGLVPTQPNTEAKGIGARQLLGPPTGHRRPFFFFK
jgi:hypothetical protein